MFFVIRINFGGGKGCDQKEKLRGKITNGTTAVLARRSLDSYQLSYLPAPETVIVTADSMDVTSLLFQLFDYCSTSIF